jgi:hypothetical protein
LPADITGSAFGPRFEAAMAVLSVRNRERRALWGMFTSRHAFFHLAPDRHEHHAKRLLAGHIGIVTSDRWWAYNHLPLTRRQLCWSHLRRDFTAHAEGLAAEKEFGEHGLALCERVFWAWEVYQHTHDRNVHSSRMLFIFYSPPSCNPACVL